ncbi:MAG: hypothetical protein ACXWUG_12645 [Polyangiales bacterium]
MTETEAKEPEASASQEDSGVRTALVLGPILTCIGIAWTAIDPSNLSSTLVLIGFATAIWGTHRYGRHGLDRGS